MLIVWLGYVSGMFGYVAGILGYISGMLGYVAGMCGYVAGMLGYVAGILGLFEDSVKVQDFISKVLYGCGRSWARLWLLLEPDDSLLGCPLPLVPGMLG